MSTGISLINAGYEYNIGKANTHTLFDVTAGIFSGVGVTIAVTVGAPVTAAVIIFGGIGYGIYSYAGGSTQIDNWTNNWGRDNFFYTK